MFLAPWMVIWPSLALASVVYGVNMFGDAVRDYLARLKVKVKVLSIVHVGPPLNRYGMMPTC